MIDTLNEAQREAVMSNHPRILCLAGAGTGKTKTMVTRAARLIEEGVDPNNMLMLTFTNAAAREQRERLIHLIGEKGEKVRASTFHSWAVNEIRRYGKSIGYDPSFSIYDQEDTESVVQAIIDDLQYKIKPKEVLEAMTKNHVYRVPIPQNDIGKVVDEYRFRCRRQNAIDIDSLIPTLQTLIEKDTINYIMHDRYKYVFVDEMQDTDQRQMRLLETLNPDNLFVVGDDFQSIYGFRGSDVSIIMGLSNSSDWHTIKLEENYRSTRQIVEPANKLIKHNNQTEKILKAHREGPAIALITQSAPEDELEWIAGKCLRIGYEDGVYGDIAILARTNKQVEAIANKLSERDIPYEIRRKTPDVLNTIEAKRLFSWMQAVINPLDDEAVSSIINWPDRILTRKEMLEVEMFQLENGCSLMTALQATGKATEVIDKIQSMQEFINEEEVTAQMLFAIIVQTIGIIGRNEEKGLAVRNKRINEIEKIIAEWTESRDTISPEDWLEYYKMRLIDGENPEDEEDAVHIMTAHGSKGLEFDTVIIAGMNEKSFPLGRGDIEEERRLMYVAITRAKTRLYMTRSATRIVWGDYYEEAEPSRFIDEM